MSWWRRLLHLEQDAAVPERPDGKMEAAQLEAAAELARQQAKLQQAKAAASGYRAEIDHLGAQVQRALRSIR